MNPSHAISRRWLPALLLLAAWARLSRLTWYSLDLDEAFSRFWAEVPLARLIPDLIALRGDPHPPAYYALLKPFLALLGVNEVGLRLLSALSGILFVALLYQTGKAMHSKPVGLAAAALATFTPPLVYESLDARMYMPAAVLTLAGSYSLWQAQRANNPALGGLAFLLLTVACYSHIAAALCVAGLGAAVLLAGLAPSLRQMWRRVLPAALTLAAVGLAYLPYLGNAWRVSGVGSGVITRAAPDVSQLFRFTAEWLFFQNAYPPAWLVTAAALLLWGAVLISGLQSGRRWRAWAWLAALLLLPLLLVALLSQRQAFLQPKMLVITTAAPALLLMGWFMAQFPTLLSRRLEKFNLSQKLNFSIRPATLGGILVLLLFLAPQLYGYTQLWQPVAQRDNWRAAAAYLQSHAGPDDVVVTHLHFYQEALRLYYDGRIVAPFGSQLSNDAEIAAGLAPYLDAEVLWLAQSGNQYTDPQNRLEQWLTARYPVITAQYPTHITLKGFLLHPHGFPPLPGAQPLDVSYANGARLTGVWLDARQLPATDRWLHPPSNWLHVVLYATPGRYVLTVEDEPGNVWGGQLPAVGQPWPEAGEQVQRLDYDINLNPEMPAGLYKVVLRQQGPSGPVLRRDTGQDWLILGAIEITPGEK